MSMSAPTPADITRLQEAGDWVQRLNESHDATLLDRWMQWCEANPLNLPAFERMQRVWNAFPEARRSNTHSSALVKHSTDFRWLMTLAAGILVLVAVASWAAWRFADDRVLETALGEQRRITLAGGSQLYLAPASLGNTHFPLGRREVRLLRGQAFFAVKHSATRPFVVSARNVTVTAIGTEFDVQI